MRAGSAAAARGGLVSLLAGGTAAGLALAAVRVAPGAAVGARELEAWVVVVACALGAVAALRLALGAALLAVAALTPSGAPRVRRLGTRLTPALVRHLLLAGLTGSLVATPAWAASAPPEEPPGVSVVWQVTPPEPSAEPSAASPAGPAPVSSEPSAPTTPAETSPAETPPTQAPPTVVPPTHPSPVDVPAPGTPPVPPDPAELLPAESRTPPTPATAPPVTTEPAGVVVRPGDSLWSIAAAHLPAGASAADVAAEWPRWWDANRAVVGTDPDLVHPGQVLVPPADPRTTRQEP